MRALHLFSGAGGGILADAILGWHTVCAVEIDAYARSVLLARQRDGWLPRFPIWDDVRTFSGHEWRGAVDVVCGGFPCQDISVAGKGAGIDGERSGLWREFARIIGEVRPGHVVVENSPALIGRGLGRVLGDLAALGYDAEWGVLGAGDVGAPHERERIWIVANANQERRPKLDHAAEPGELGLSPWGHSTLAWWDSDPGSEREPGLVRVADGVARGLDAVGAIAGETVDHVAPGVPSTRPRLRALGNGQVPACAAEAFKILEQQKS